MARALSDPIHNLTYIVDTGLLFLENVNNSALIFAGNKIPNQKQHNGGSSPQWPLVETRLNIF